MNEYFLHYLWRHRLFEMSQMTCESGEDLAILHPGFYNRDAGPDFQEALLRIGDTRWMGSVELHVKSSEWKVHGHSSDPAYNNVILHVVWEHDAEVSRNDDSLLPVFTLQKRVEPALVKRYSQLSYSHEPIPCARQWKGHFPRAALQMLERAAVERLEKRTAHILKLVAERQGDWEAACWLWLARAFGQRVNADAFERLAGSLPWKLVQRLAIQPFQLEAALFGQAGFLHSPTNAHQQKLQKEYRYLTVKYGIQPAIGLQWKRLRMYPAAFPQSRLEQLYRLLKQHPRLLADLLDAQDVKALRHLFAALTSADEGVLNSPKSRKHSPAKATLDRWLINAAVPLVFAYGHFHQLPELTEKAVRWLESLAAETNHVTRQYNQFGLTPLNALHSQGLLELNAVYCNAKRCLDCLIGNHWLLKTPP